MSDGDHNLKRFIIEGGGEYARFLEGKGDHDDIMLRFTASLCASRVSA